MLNDDPKKAKRWVWIGFAIAVLLLVVSGFFTFLYYGTNDQSIWKEGLISDKDSEIAELTSQLDVLTTEKDELSSTAEGEKGTLEEQNAALKAKIAGATAYNNFLKHLNSVIETHGGFTGWTDAEYQTGLALAQATGNSAFVNTITWAWTQTSIGPVVRVLRVLKETASGIENALK